MPTETGQGNWTDQMFSAEVTKQRTCSALPALTSSGVLTAAMLPLTATSSRRPLVLTGSVSSKGSDPRDAGMGQRGPGDGWREPLEMPVGKPVERCRVVVLIQAPRQLSNHRVIETRKGSSVIA